jgi:DUF4097 and DUF4098 domain-containing protein YvlB
MKKLFQYFIFAIFCVMSCATFGQKADIDKLSVPFSDASRPGWVKASLVNGGMTVVGYNGKEVVVEAQIRNKISLDDESENDKAKGMKRIRITSAGLTVEEENNVIKISTDSWKRAIDLDIKVPFKTSLNLSCVNSGDIVVENVDGEFDINNVNGAVTLKDVSGAVVAHALNKDLIVTLKKIDPEKSMSFSSLNGDVDVTFPKNLKATLKLKSDNGNIYSDFDMTNLEANRNIVEENTRKKNGKYRIRLEDAMTVKINGGGSEIQFKTFNGDILVRKGE